jgi:hypothetical protein
MAIMGLLSRWFGSPGNRETERMFDEARQKAEQQIREIEPLHNIVIAIFEAAHTCKQELKSLFVSTDEKATQLGELKLIYEYVYFFMHLTMRECFGLLGDLSRQRLQNFLMPIITFESVESTCGHWPEERKELMRSEFISNMNNAELEYGTCVDLYSNDDFDFQGNSLFSCLVRNISQELEPGLDPIRATSAITSILTVSVKAYEAMKLENLIVVASGLIDSDKGDEHVRKLAEYERFGSVISGLVLFNRPSKS